jgi:predicted transcriptional regulator
MGLRQKPIQEYRPTEEPKAAPTADAGESAGLENVLQVAEAENAIQEKLGLLRKQIQDMELSRNALNEATKAQSSAKGELDETMKAFNAAKDSANNIVSGIVAQIVRVENMRLTAHLDEGSVAQVQEINRTAIEHEREVLAQHRKEQ